MIQRIICAIILLVTLSAVTNAQVIKGKVIDATNGNPIAHASIYLNGSSKGTISDEQGIFLLETTETKIPLVVSYVGYQSETILDYANKVLNIKLKPRANELTEVVIGGGGGMTREEKLKIFITQFIGATSKDCIITNPDDIKLSYKKSTKTLEAESSNPLIILNKKLGYKITYFLSAFKHTPEEIFYEGNYFFEEDTAGLKPNDIKKILKARDRVYLGSRMHFMRSLFDNKLAKNNFLVSEQKNTDASQSVFLNNVQYTNSSARSITGKDVYDSLVVVDGSNKYFLPKTPLIIEYDRELSLVAINPPAVVAPLTKNGYTGHELSWGGQMSQQRINVLLPYEFELQDETNKATIPDNTLGIIKDAEFVKILAKQDSFVKSHKSEKLYIQTDKSNYTSGDTIRLKAYLLNPDSFTPTTTSGVLYVELDDKDGKPAKRIMLPVTQGFAWADIALNSEAIISGNYTLRGYTKWMRNFGEDYIFKKDISISAVAINTTIVKASFKPEAGKIETALQFATLDGKPMLLKDMELKLMDGKKNLFKNQVNTGVDGFVKFTFNLPQSNTPITLQAKDVTKGINDAPDLTIPAPINRPESTDLQFMPEGGNLVAGIKTKVGFKALNEDGKGNNNISGKILNSKQQEVASFKTSYAGMGSFEFTPKAGEVYTASINGINKSFPLPTVNEIGTGLKVEQNDSDSLVITVSSRQLTNVNSPYYLIGESRGVICFTQIIGLTRDQTRVVKVAKELFPTGITRFTLINSNKQPVNDRQLFINRHDNLNITVNTNKSKYGIRDSVHLLIDVKDKDGKPVQGNFSLAVTDDSQVRTDSLSNNMVNHLLLTSNLKGNIEDPGYYFINAETRQQELDNLMLTQGWIGYDWKEILSTETKPIAFQSEKEYTISGKVTNALGKGVELSPIILLSYKPRVITDALSGKDGRFEFKDIWPVDTAIFKLQARNRNNKEFNVSITMDEQTFPEFKPQKYPPSPWYVNADTTILRKANTVIATAKAEREHKGEGLQLKEVNVKAKKVVKRSSNLNGPGEADLVIDENDMLKAGKKTLENLLYEKIPGFGTGPFTPSKRRYDELVGFQSSIFNTIRKDFPGLTDKQINSIYTEVVTREGKLNPNNPKKHKPWRYGYVLNDQEVRFIIDGVNLDHFYDERDEVMVAVGDSVLIRNNDTKRYQYIKTHLLHFTAEDILGIEVLSSGRYTNRYNSRYEEMMDRAGPGTSNEAAYIEITTRTKQGPFMEPTIGTYLHKSLAFTLPKQFYSPKYTVSNKNKAIGTDMRSTLHWVPNITTDIAGKADITFFTADKPTNYTYIIEGVSTRGELGHKTQSSKTMPLHIPPAVR